MFIKGDKVRTLADLKLMHPNVSFGPTTPAEMGWEPYTPPQPEPVPLDYAQLRAGAYKPLQEQMDMQYWDIINGTTTWADHIAAVKAQFPKPAQP